VRSGEERPRIELVPVETRGQTRHPHEAPRRARSVGEQAAQGFGQWSCTSTRVCECTASSKAPQSACPSAAALPAASLCREAASASSPGARQA
jgi:hypothetical protein